jgi:DDE superfamily endonuclease
MLYRPENAKELFNLRHASLRNAIERIFGVVKRKFKILDKAGEFSVDTQVHLVLALLGLYNFIRRHEGVDLTEDIDEEDEDEEAGDTTPLPSTNQSEGAKAMTAFRDRIAKEMWNDYRKYIGRDN